MNIAFDPNVTPTHKPGTRIRRLPKPGSKTEKITYFYGCVKFSIFGDPMEDWINEPKTTRGKALTIAKRYIRNLKP